MKLLYAAIAIVALAAVAKAVQEEQGAECEHPNDCADDEKGRIYCATAKFNEADQKCLECVEDHHCPPNRFCSKRAFTGQEGYDDSIAKGQCIKYGPEVGKKCLPESSPQKDVDDKWFCGLVTAWDDSDPANPSPIQWEGFCTEWQCEICATGSRRDGSSSQTCQRKSPKSLGGTWDNRYLSRYNETYSGTVALLNVFTLLALFSCCTGLWFNAGRPSTVDGLKGAVTRG